MKQYKICLAATNKWTPWANLDFPFPADVTSAADILNIQFSEELTVAETIAFWNAHRLS